MEDKEIFYIDRKTGEKKEEQVYFEDALRFLYGTSLGRTLGKLIAKLPLFSYLTGWWQRRSFTRSHILPFITKYHIDPSEFAKPVSQYPSFDAFFTRALRPGARSLEQGVIAPADGRYLVYPNAALCDGYFIKGKKFSLTKLLGDSELAKKYAEGSMVIARLAPCDYHRFHFPVDCCPGAPKLINGPLFSVNPIAVKQNVELLTENKRIITPLSTVHYGTPLFIEIGATNVGSIHQTFIPGNSYKKGDEKGFFSFGGSCVILLFEPGMIQFANDLIGNSLQHVETLCLFGQSLENRK